jgi:uncharacterized protein (UPF0335 family)
MTVIYILKNYYIPNVYKVGYTTRDAVERAKEISRATGVPGDWEVAREWPVMDAYQTEQYIFLEFEEYRIQKKELFNFIGTSLEEVIKTMDVLLSNRQKSLIEYIENLNRHEARLKEAVKEVEQALTAEQYDVQYITHIRETIQRVNRESKLVEINDLKKKNKKLVIYILITVALVIFLKFQFDIGSFLSYGFFAVILFFMVVAITTNNDEIKFSNQKLFKYSLENLPKNLSELKVIMNNLDINHLINIDNIEINMRTESKKVVLETVRKGVSVSQKYSCSEKEALVRFILYLKSN